MSESSNRHQLTTYVNSKYYDEFLKKCRGKEITPYTFLKRCVINFINEEE